MPDDSMDSSQPTDVVLYQIAQRSAVKIGGDLFWRFCLHNQCAIGKTKSEALHSLRSKLENLSLWRGAGAKSPVDE